MDIHVDQQDRSTLFLGQPTMPDSFLSQTQMQAVEFLEGCVRGLEPLAALTGGAGTGKTFVLNMVLERIGGRAIRVNNFVAGPLSLHRVLAAAVGVPDAGDLSAEALEPVLRRALATAGKSEPPLLAVDDAQSLLPETLHYLCLLAGLREAGRPLLRILLVGRPGFTVRQSMPLQFTLNAASLEDTRRMVLHGLDTAGISASDEAVQDIVGSSQGNLRKLELLLGASIEQAKASGRRRIASVGVQPGAGAYSRARSRRRGAPISPWLAVPALLVVGVAGAGVAYHNGVFHQAPDRAVSAPPIRTSAASLNPAPPVALPAPAPVVTATREPARLPSVPAPAPLPLPAIPPAVAPVSVAPVVSPPSAPAPAPAPSTSGTAGSEPATPAPAAPEPAKPEAAASAPADPSPANPTPVVPPPAAGSAGPATSDALPSPPAEAPQPAPPAQAGTSSAGARFRVYNISSCHQGVCPRWSVTDLDQQSRFVAAFNPSNLHLDRGTMQKLREGSLDLIVSGSVRRGGGGSQTLEADSLQSIAPHHGRPRPSASDPIDLAPPPIQSPPPGFLTLPPGESPNPAPAVPGPLR